MSVQVTAFPEKIEVRLTQSPSYGWPVTIELGNGSRVYLSDELADQLSQDLWNRRLDQKAAA